MHWINLRTEQLRSPDFANAKPGAIETWLRVLAYCCEQENGGQIREACKWNDRGWMSACGVTKSEVENAAPLVFDDGVDVFALAYPTEKEAEVKAKREAGKIGGKRSGRSRALKHKRSTASSTASSSPRTEGEGEGERKENNSSPTSGEKSEHSVFIGWWTTEYPKHHHGESYAFQGGKDSKAVEMLLRTSKRNIDQLKLIAVAAWNTNGNGFHAKAAASLSGFNSRFNDIVDELNRHKTKKRNADKP